MPPSYRERLRLEGAALAACGAAACAALLIFVPDARENATSTIGQLAFVGLLCALLGPFLARRWTGRAEQAPTETTGDPTPLWQLPLITAGLALLVALPTGSWDAGLRVTGGCLLVGLTQAGLMAPLVGRDERRRGRRYVRLPGSSLFTGTRLGYSET
ncbi:MAG: hypothetical protein WKF29_04180 [Thermoleophilaceae bacterium]